MKPPPPPGNPLHLWTAGCALAAAGVLAFGSHAFIEASVRRHVERFNVFPQPEKLLGVALPRQAFRDPALLPVYGSSELTQPQTHRADEFFAAHPTGFGAFLMGNPGETCLIIATKLAAAGPAATGKKAVVFLSPGWFQAPELDEAGFRANFSPLHGGILAADSCLGPDLKRDLARRLLDYPKVLRQMPLLAPTLDTLAGRATTADRATMILDAPFRGIQNVVQREMDAFWVGVRPLKARLAGTDAKEGGSIDWARRLKEADQAYARQPAQTEYSTGPKTWFDDNLRRRFVDPKHPEIAPDENFERACLASKEWADLDLLLRTARETKVRLLVVCQPLNAKFGQRQGLTARSSTLFYDRLREAVAPYKVRLLTFPDAEHDPHFYQDCTHPSAKAWIAYDAALDAFFHEVVGENAL